MKVLVISNHASVFLNYTWITLYLGRFHGKGVQKSLCEESQLKKAICVYFLKILVWSKIVDNGFV